jgi:hypothetical protein
MAEYTYDPTQGKIVPLAQARVVTYITNDPKGMPASNEAAREATGSSSGAQPQTGSAASYGLADLQNAARLAAEAAVTAASPFNTKSTKGDELLKKEAIAAAVKAATTAATNANTELPVIIDEKNYFDRPPGAPTSATGFAATGATGSTGNPAKTTATATTVKVNDPNKSPGKAWTWNGSKWVKPPVPSKNEPYSWDDETGWKLKEAEPNTDVIFSELTAEQQAAIGAIGDGVAVKPAGLTGGRTVVSTFINPATGDTYAIYTDGTRELLFKGTKEADAATASAAEELAAEQAAALAAEAKINDGRSAYNLLFAEFDRYGLGALVEPLKKFIEEGLSPAEFTIRLRETDAYKKRFAANAQRVAKGLRALSEAEYIGTEDQYQDVMRRYGMPESYYAKGDLGVQSGFEKFLAGDVSAVELEDRIQTAQNRVVNSNPEVSKALKEFYPGISNGDILSYVLDPTNAIEQIKRKVTAAEIGGAAIQSGLGYKGDTPEAMRARAEELAAAGITKQQAQSGFGTIAGGLQRGSQLASIYGEDPYKQATAETEVFGLAGAQDAAKQRKKITGLERAAFSGQSGASTGALARDRAGAY